MKKQTAIEWLISQLWEAKKTKSNWKELEKKAKEIEREQIINAYDAGTFYLEGGLYYKETFEDEKGI
jgi:hypothetical protein